MIESKYLRIGNYVDYEATTHVISAIGHTESWSYWLNKTDSNDEYLHQNSELKPIDLTEQWLLKFGFAKVKSIPGSYYKNGFRFHSQRPGNTEGFLWNTETYYWDRDVLVKGGVKYLHELQNLYYALTRSELTAEPTR